jgi:hypothetical protein
MIGNEGSTIASYWTLMIYNDQIFLHKLYDKKRDAKQASNISRASSDSALLL